MTHYDRCPVSARDKRTGWKHCDDETTTLPRPRASTHHDSGLLVRPRASSYRNHVRRPDRWRKYHPNLKRRQSEVTRRLSTLVVAPTESKDLRNGKTHARMLAEASENLAIEESYTRWQRWESQQISIRSNDGYYQLFHPNGVSQSWRAAFMLGVGHGTSHSPTRRNR
jgi:hypothetical protein